MSGETVSLPLYLSPMVLVSVPFPRIFFSLSLGRETAGFLMIAHPVLSRLALAELYLTLATVFSRFDFQLYETGIENIQLESDGFMPIMKSPHGVRVLVRRVERG